MAADEGLTQMAQRIADRVLRALVEGLAANAIEPRIALRLALEHVDSHRPATASRTSDDGLLLADAGLGAEGRAVIDPCIRELGRRVADGRMTGDEAAPFIAALAKAREYKSDPSTGDQR